ncbi:MAG: signal peptidase I, partial [Acidobacteriota bacterium]
IKAQRGREVALETPDFLEQARQMLSRGIPVAMRMSGSSMRPTIEDGDMVTIKPIDENSIKPGDIILYQTRFDTAVIHRVVRIDRQSSERVVITRADSSNQPDIPVALHRVLGRVNLIERGGEPIKMSRPRSRFKQWLQARLSRLKSWVKR